MYVISDDPKIPSGPISFEDDKAELVFTAGRVILEHNNDAVSVERE